MTSNESLKIIYVTNDSKKITVRKKNNWNLNCIKVQVQIEKGGIKNT